MKFLLLPLWQEQTLPAFPVVLIPERSGFLPEVTELFYTVACSYFFIVVVRGILDYTQDYKSKDP